MKLGRNDPCHCGSGNKYKKCCATKDEAAHSAKLAEELAAQAAARAALEAEAEAAPAVPTGSPKAARAVHAGPAPRPGKAPPKSKAQLRKHAV